MCGLSATLFSRRHMSTACGWPLGYFLGTVIAGWHVVGLMATFCVPLWQGACLARCLLGVDLLATFVSRSCPTMVRTLGVLFVACLSAWLGPCLGPSIKACSLGCSVMALIWFVQPKDPSSNPCTIIEAQMLCGDGRWFCDGSSWPIHLRAQMSVDEPT